MRLLCFGVARRDFERVTGGLAPACRVDVRVVRVHPLVVDVAPAVVVDLGGNSKGGWGMGAQLALGCCEGAGEVQSIHPSLYSRTPTKPWWIVNSKSTAYMDTK